MLCEKCKVREANIQYTEVMDGVKTEHNFCISCAKEMDFGPYGAIFDGDFPLGKLLSGLLQEDDMAKRKEKLNHILCPGCGTSYEAFVQNSCFGCKDCYSVFGPLIEEQIRKLQGNAVHTGKKPNDQVGDGMQINSDFQVLDQSEEVQVLERKLREALRKEEYEEAAKYRDMIKEMKKGAQD